MQTKPCTMIPTAQPAYEYEVYPHCPPERFARWFLEHNQILLEGFMKNEGIDPDALPHMIDEVLIEWELKSETHRDRKDAVRHLINHLRIKKREQRNNQSRQIRAFARPNQDADERMADIAQELLRQSAGRDKP